MKTFFKNLESLHQFTLQLDLHQDQLKCWKCQRQDQFVSHGFIYEEHGDKEKIGKRIFCSNRYGRSGCGATRRLYIATRIPNLLYATSHLTAFLCALLQGLCIQQAYQKATKTKDPRQAYRWLRKLEIRLIDYRQFLRHRTSQAMGLFSSRVQRFRILLPTFQALFSLLEKSPCPHYQMMTQRAFI